MANANETGRLRALVETGIAINPELGFDPATVTADNLGLDGMRERVELHEGHLTVEQARRHPSRSLVLEALDGKPDRIPVITSLIACPEDRLLLCSDGLSDVVELDALQKLLVAHESRDACVDALVHLALDSGAHDNVSAIVIDIVPRSDPTTAWPLQLDPSSTAAQ